MSAFHPLRTFAYHRLRINRSAGTNRVNGPLTIFGAARTFVVAAILLACASPVNAAPASATATAVLKAKVVKPLTLSATQSLDLGTIILSGGTWSGAVVSVSRTGAHSCSNARVTCTGTFQAAKYRVTGSNNETVVINAPNALLTNQADPTQTLTMTVDSPGTVVLSNSGNQGLEFALGGSITVSSSTAGGIYSGTFNVTVDYR